MVWREDRNSDWTNAAYPLRCHMRWSLRSLSRSHLNASIVWAADIHVDGTQMKGKEGKKADSQDIVVFSILKGAVCSDCNMELGSGSLLRTQADKAYCLDCADLGHLVFLPSGDVALTRRSRKYSSLSAVVVRFSRARGRYERQGLLVELAALERAEAECLGDDEARRAARERAASNREEVDARYVEEFADHVRREFPGCSTEEAKGIAAHACEKHSGRVGRSAGARAFDADAVELAVRAHIRHKHTEYDLLLAKGWERDAARTRVADVTGAVVKEWRSKS